MDKLLTTKLFVPSARAELVPRSRLVEQLNAGLCPGCKLILISAPAGSGKTTLMSEWIVDSRRRAAWVSLDAGDKDPSRFLAYLVAALQTISANIGAGVMAALQSTQPPATESILTSLLNEIAGMPDDFILVLDDYHVVDSKAVDLALNFLLEHMPAKMHLVIVTREDPEVPLARLRAKGQLTELRAADLRFTPTEAVEFLNRVMGLTLSPEDIDALENRTEGWIAGLQLAALSLQRQKDVSSFIKSFTGSHHFVLDYLMEEVLQQQPQRVQRFLLCTSILERLCGSLCDAVLLASSVSGQETLEYLERSNLFIVPLDNERHWYRYHHLFADLLRQRLQQRSATHDGEDCGEVGELHLRASIWYEENGLEMEAFLHAAAAHDIERAERLIEKDVIPLHSRSAVTAVLDWLASLPKSVLDARPSLWLRYASLLLVTGQTTGVGEMLQAAENGLQDVEPDDKTRNLIGQIAAARATLALSQYQIESIFTQSRRALEYLPPKTCLFGLPPSGRLHLLIFSMENGLKLARHILTH